MHAARTGGQDETKQAATRLNAADWIAAALTMLAAEGIDKVRIETIARRLNVTKGSFYWHFRDRADLLARMIDEWRAKAIADLDSATVPDDRVAEALAELIDLPFRIDVRASPMQLALAMRLWARRDERVAAAIAEVDRLRVVYFARLFEAAGAPSAEARARATLLYSYMRTALMLIDPRDTSLRDECRKLLVGLPPDGGPASDANA